MVKLKMSREEKEKRFHELMKDQARQMIIDLEKDSKLPGYKLSNEDYFLEWIAKNAKKFTEIWEDEHK
jgi:hypothetical protein